MAHTHVFTGTLAAYFEDSSDARKAFDALKQAGFQSAHLGIAHHGTYTGISTTLGNTTVYETSEENNEPSTWDKIKAWFSGESPETIASQQRDDNLVNRSDVGKPADDLDPGYDDTSDLQPSFTALNLPEDRARYFAHRFRNGKNSAVVTVEAVDRVVEAESILQQHNGDLGENAATYKYAETQGAYSNSLEERVTQTATEQPANTYLLGEVLRVHRVRAGRGEVLAPKDARCEEAIPADSEKRERSA
jgi:hypothetical protein